nr:helicase-related protein [Exiguobacterium sp. s124]
MNNLDARELKFLNENNKIEEGISEEFYLSNELIRSYYTSGSNSLLDYYQKAFLDKFDSLNSKKIFLSAPTSFGKTFLLKELILKYKYNNVILIFPTISLLIENINEIETFCLENTLDYKIVNSKSQIIRDKGNIFILTPERVLNLLAEYPKIEIDFFFMDEIYKLDDSLNESQSLDRDRDKVFRIALYLLSKKVESYYLAGPYIDLENLGEGFKKFVRTNEIELFQVHNELVKKEYYETWKKNIYINKNKLQLEGNKVEKTVTLLNYINKHELGQTIVFCANQNQILEIANSIYSNTIMSGTTNRYNSFIEHLNYRYGFYDNDVEVRWSIPDMLQRGVGVHHGSIPRYIQTEILNFFNKGIIDTIISTTSITEGVNTNAKNIIFFGNSKGGKPFKFFDIKNIIGRAGRYYHHFVGRTFFMEKNTYDRLQSNAHDTLDYVTFTEREMNSVDIDNTDKEDLMGNNYDRKINREIELLNFNFSEEIFVKNRLIDKLSQAQLADSLMKLDSSEINAMKERYSSIKKILENGILYDIFEKMYNVGIIQEHEKNLYPAIAGTYSMKGFKGLLSYEIKKMKDGKSALEWIDYNKCYKKAFDKLKKIIEYRIPKLLNVYFEVFKYVYVEKVKAVELNFDYIITFFETGIFSEMGTYLFEKGYPIETIKELERSFQEIMNLEIGEFSLNKTKNLEKLSKTLDTYELLLLDELI